MEATIGLWILATVLVTIGVIGLALPAMPGAPLLFGGLVLGAWADDFQYVGMGTIAGLAALALLTYAIDIAAGALGAKKFGASNRAIFGAAAGALIGLFFGLIGILVGPFIGAAVGEYTHRRELGAAGMAGIGATLGFIVGAIAKLAIAFTMVGWFALLRF